MDEARGAAIQSRLDAVGITNSEFAERAGVDRGTLLRALKDDPTTGPRTWGKIEGALERVELDEGAARSGRMVTSTVQIGDVTVTFEGASSDVADAIRRMIDKP